MNAPLTFLAICLACFSSSAALVLRESFDYADGALTNVSGSRWRTHSGIGGETTVLYGQVELSRLRTEDVNALLDGAPFSSSGPGALYARFNLVVSELPTGSGTFFAHLNGSSSQRGRVFITATGAKTGKFRLGIANGSSSVSSIWPTDLIPGQIYSVMMRYTVSNAQATLWVDAMNETNASISAVDIASASSVSAFSWRQESSIGTLVVDDLVVATSFAEALTGNPSPVFSTIPDQVVGEGGTTAPIPFSVTDDQFPPDWLQFFTSTSNSNLVRGILVDVLDSNATIRVSAASNQVGTAVITLGASDGVTTNFTSFVLNVLPSLIFADEFSYADGPLIVSGAPTWTRHSGGTGEVMVANGEIALATPLTEDVNVILPYGPFAPSGGPTLYASMRVMFLQLPGSGGDYFAHFNTNGTRCRLFVNTTGAAAGKFRFGIANASGGIPTQLATDCMLNVPIRIVMRYDTQRAVSTLWVNPVAETNACTNAVDVTTPNEIAAFGFRQSSNMGRFTVDDLRLGLTFAAVTQPNAPRLRIERIAPESVRLVWPVTASGYVLQWTPDTLSLEWWDDTEVPVAISGCYIVTNYMWGGPVFYRLVKRPIVPPTLP